MAIASYVKSKYDLIISSSEAENLKLCLGTADKSIDRGTLEVCGRDLRSGLAKTVEVSTAEVREAMREPLSEIIAMVKMTLEETPPELSADIFDFGIVMTGGGAQLPGLDEAIHKRTGIRVIIPKKPQPADCVCVGLGRMLQSTGGDFSEFVRYKVK
jgi:rod shape-determining protein MreB